MKFFIPTIVALFSLAALPAMANPHDVNGLWLTESKTGHVQIADCGDGTPCGTLVWIEDADQLDVENPDPALRTRKVLGMQMIWGFQKKEKNWAKGNIYDASEGKTYRSAIKMLADGTLEVKGCVGPICKAQIWVKIE